MTEPDDDVLDDGDDTEAQWPHELRRCTCGTRSFARDDHHNGCALGPQPPVDASGWPRLLAPGMY